jgi:uncharacterized membrane-anchored protein
MRPKHQILHAYEAGRNAYEQSAANRGPWESLITLAISTAAGLLAYYWLARHTSLAAVWRFGVAAVVAALLRWLFMAAADKLRPASGV